MSDFLRDPNFKPDESLKYFIDNVLSDQSATTAPVKEVRKRKNTLKLELPHTPELSGEDLEKAFSLAKDEMETLRLNFLDFQDKIRDLEIRKFLHPKMEDFGKACSDMSELIDNIFIHDEFSEAGKAEYREAMKIRSHILSSVFNKYKGNS